jgi:hypothetical protein
MPSWQGFRVFGSCYPVSVTDRRMKARLPRCPIVRCRSWAYPSAGLGEFSWSLKCILLEVVLFAEPLSGGGSARLRWRSCDLETLFRKGRHNCCGEIYPLLGR